jgi:hypothetical protein
MELPGGRRARSLAVPRFDPASMLPDRLTVLLGKRGGGKTTTMFDIMYHKRDAFSSGVVMSGTEAGNKAWSDVVPKSFIFGKYRPDVLWGMIRAQMKQRAQFGDASPVFLVLEDVLYDKTLRSCEALRWLFMNGRHAKIFCIISMQYYASMGPDLRSQIDYVICTRQRSLVTKEALWRHFFGMIPDERSFLRLFDTVTNPPYTMVVLDNVKESNKISEVVSWYKAQQGHTFKLGNKDYWAYHFANYRGPLDQGTDAVALTMPPPGGSAAGERAPSPTTPADGDDSAGDDEPGERSNAIAHVSMLPSYVSKLR